MHIQNAPTGLARGARLENGNADRADEHLLVIILKMVVVVVAIVLVALWFFLLRPRRGGKNAPPLVTESPVVPIPFIGVICEFFKGPNNMMKRCHRDYGPVFTIPVRRILVQIYGGGSNANTRP
jgi:heme/copper-type cytochrome/quinol oxidase subunit 2